jgi:pyruvate ferredoxin oxidoreductase gamma subunit
VREELGEIGLPEALIRRNEDLARACLAEADVTPLSVDRLGAPEPAVQLSVPAYDDPTVGTPSVYAPGNMPLRKTGGWRTVRPVINLALCNQCWICFVRCPEGAISLDEKDNPHIDYDHCKGCLICVEECPMRRSRRRRSGRGERRADDDGEHGGGVGARLAGASTSPRNPITPQTEIIETLSRWFTDGTMRGSSSRWTPSTPW